MKRQLTFALVSITLIAALGIGAAVMGYVYNRYVNERDLAIQFAEYHLQQRFVSFDQLIANDEARLDATIETILPEITERLVNNPNFPDNFSQETLNSVAAEFGADEIFVINKEGYIVSTNFLPDKNFFLRGVSQQMAELLDGLYGSGEIVIDRFNISVNTGVVKKYSYYGPEGGDYIVEIAHHLKPFIASLHSDDYVRFLFDEKFALDPASSRGITGADIYIPHDVGVWSLLNPEKKVDWKLTENILSTMDVLKVSDGAFKMDVFRRFERVNASQGQTPYIITHITYDHSEMAGYLMRLAAMMIAIATGVLVGAFFILSKILDRSLLRHIDAIVGGLKALGEGKNGDVALTGAPQEIVMIGEAIDNMQGQILAREKALRMVNDEFQDKLKQRTAELVAANQQLAELSLTDALTGLTNRRGFDEVLQNELKRMRRSAKPLALLLLDVDYFKRFNDSAGHVAGDACLRQIGKFLDEKTRRTSDVVARYGGEEFAIILPEMPAEQARAYAQSIVEGIAALAIVHPDSEISQYVSASIGGISVQISQDLEHKCLVDAADQRLYRAKENGRNQVVFEEMAADGCAQGNLFGEDAL